MLCYASFRRGRAFQENYRGSDDLHCTVRRYDPSPGSITSEGNNGHRGHALLITLISYFVLHLTAYLRPYVACVLLMPIPPSQ